MIYEMSKDIADTLHARKFPTVHRYGAQRIQRSYGDRIVLIERDIEQTDSFAPPVGSKPNPNRAGVRSLAGKVTIFAASALHGAMLGDHEKICEALVDALIVAIKEWGVASRAGDIPLPEMRYLTPKDREDAEAWPGVVYMIRFRVPRSVNAVDYAGQARPTGSASGVSNEIDITQPGAPPLVVILPTLPEA